jgi:ubiquinone/menaquinone biosynthesis C-methylase UbiE/uncharacterized protein YbaR (Trm112 family)/alkylhydroperoxidase/carboxymuconolactone decarboxylase family protein YurZ
VTPADADLLICPTCNGPLAYRGRTASERITNGVLQCHGCGTAWPVDDGVPHLYDPGEVRGSDYLLRFVYDVIAPWHDLSVKLVLPVLQTESADKTRDGYMERLQLAALAPRNGTPVRILEVGVGGGANLPLIERDVPAAVDNLEVWGLDLSAGMLGQCRRRIRRTPFGERVRLMLADAHALPFPDASFDRVFHVGGIAGYRDARRALAEMARVARPGTPIVVVDEQLDRARRNTLYHRFIFWAITIYDPNPHAPAAEIPPYAVCDESTQVSRFYYCLRFHVPASKEHPMDSNAGIALILSDDALVALRKAYVADEMTKAIGAVLPAQYPATREYTDAIMHALYPLQGDTPLAADDRERCLITLLASHGAKRNLAIHVYMGLMAELAPREICHILLLVGAYAGVDTLPNGLAIAQKTFQILADLVAKRAPCGAVDVLKALADALPM